MAEIHGENRVGVNEEVLQKSIEFKTVGDYVACKIEIENGFTAHGKAFKQYFTETEEEQLKDKAHRRAIDILEQYGYLLVGEVD